MASPDEVTRLLKQWANGDQSAVNALTPLVYGELRRLAASYMRSESPGHTLQPTALVHEAFLRLVGHAPDCENRSQFYGVAAHLMRQILIDHARTRQAVKRGGRVEHLCLDAGWFVDQQRFDFAAQGFISATGLLEELKPPAPLHFQGGMKQLRDLLQALRFHLLCPCSIRAKAKFWQTASHA
jgi:DNA-directed RNA polymerase specialized sigma24 family protein